MAFESSGAFGKTAKKVWSRLKFLADEAELDNYVIVEKPYTWTAFTFEQMSPQRVSWAIMVHNAEQILCGARISRRFIQPHMRGVSLSSFPFLADFPLLPLVAFTCISECYQGLWHVLF